MTLRTEKLERLFKTPEAVVADPTLSRAEKIALLRSLEYDARERAVALEEGMAGGDTDLLRRVLEVLRAFGAASDTASTPPTKQGGH